MRDANEISVSIVVPVFNRENFLEETIRSVISQSNPNWELILVDDGSTDRSVEICRKFSVGDSRIRFIQRMNENKGAASCRNIGIRNAKSNYVLFLDSDDLLAEWCVQQRLSFFKRESSALDFAVFPMLLFRVEKEDMRILQNIPTEIHPLNRFLQRENVWLMSSVLWSKEFLEKLKGFNSLALSFQDWEIHVRALIHSDNWKFFDQAIPDNFYRQHGETISASRFTILHVSNNLETFMHCFGELKETSKMDDFRRKNFGSLIFEWLKRFYGIAMEKEERIKLVDKYLSNSFHCGIFSEKEYKRLKKYFKYYNHPLFLRVKLLGKIYDRFHGNILSEFVPARSNKHQAKHIYTGELNFNE